VDYDKESFLAGLATGRQLKGWATGGTIVRAPWISGPVDGHVWAVGDVIHGLEQGYTWGVGNIIFEIES
jgi:hypothetical protein